METKEWYEIRTKLGAMFSKYLTNEITYAEIENQVIGWIEEASKQSRINLKINPERFDNE